MEKRSEVLKKFGGRVQELRKAKGLSQEKLGFACNLSQTYISEVEQGKRNISLLNLHAIASALEITLAHLMEEVV
jgi:transcriptional regulator with XRE-family HTH domain